MSSLSHILLLILDVKSSITLYKTQLSDIIKSVMKKLYKFTYLLPLVALLITGCKKDNTPQPASSEPTPSSSEVEPTSSSSTSDEDWRDLPPECDEDHVKQADEILVQLPAYSNDERASYNVYMKYGDELLSQDTKVFSKDIAFLSYAASVYSEFRVQLDQFYQDIGFDNRFYAPCYTSTPTADTIGYFFAHRTIGEEEVIAVTIRGFGYGQEWANNFMIGESGNHTGFDERTEEVLLALDEYIQVRFQNCQIKLWLTGYSRGGAIANMLAQKVLSRNKFGVTEDTLMAYTFEAARGLTKENAPAYKSVFNLVNHADVVPKVGPELYGLYRCGIDIDLWKDNIEEVLYRYDHGLVLPSFKLKPGKVDTPDTYADYVLSSATRHLSDSEASIETRELFHNNYEPTISYAMGLVFGLDNITLGLLMNSLMENITDVLMNDDGLFNAIYPVLDQRGIEYDISELRTHCLKLSKLISGPANNIKYDALNNNFTWMIMQHYPDVNFVLLRALDK